MNQCRSSRKLFRKKNVRDLLPALPCEITIEPWWIVCVGCVTEEDIKVSGEFYLVVYSYFIVFKVFKDMLFIMLKSDTYFGHI